MTQEEAVAAGSAIVPEWNWVDLWNQYGPVVVAMIIKMLTALLPMAAAPNTDPWANLSDDVKRSLADILDRLRIKLLS